MIRDCGWSLEGSTSLWIMLWWGGNGAHSGNILQARISATERQYGLACLIFAWPLQRKCYDCTICLHPLDRRKVGESCHFAGDLSDQLAVTIPSPRSVAQHICIVTREACASTDQGLLSTWHR